MQQKEKGQSAGKRRDLLGSCKSRLGGFRFASFRRLFARRQKWFAKGVFEIISAREISAIIGFGLCKQANFDHVENQFAKSSHPFIPHDSKTLITKGPNRDN